MKPQLILLSSLFLMNTAYGSPCSNLFRDHSSSSRRLASAENDEFQKLKTKIAGETDTKVLKAAVATLWQALEARAERDQAYRKALSPEASATLPSFLEKAKAPLALRETALYLMRAIWYQVDPGKIEGFLRAQESLDDLSSGCRTDDPVLSPGSSKLFKN